MSNDFHAITSITIGELAEDGLINWDDNNSDAPSMDWSQWAYSAEQYSRVCEQFICRFWLREISIYPLKNWALMVKQLFRELSAKYNPLYKSIEEGVNPLADSDTWHKGRDVFSDFPATQLSPENQDYASNASDKEEETIIIGNMVDNGIKLKEQWKSVDAMLLDEMAPYIFSSLYSVNINGF